MSNAFLEIRGGRCLSGGRIQVSGSANQVTKAIMASMLSDEPVLIKGCPAINERAIVEDLFRELGGTIDHKDENTIELTGRTLDRWEISQETCKKNRIAILALGPLLHRFKKATLFATLGGDQIGKRPVDFHLHGLEQMGAKVNCVGERLEISLPEGKLCGTRLVLPFPSVMTTENLLMTAVLAEGRTVIENAAIEPEIIELVKMLQKMGADIMYNAHRTFVITGVKRLRGCAIRLMIDRNEAVSYACAALATGGDVLIENVPHDPVYSFLNFIQRMGAHFRTNSEGLYVAAPKPGPLRGTHIEVEVHPGFMTDWQQPFMVLFTQAAGVSVLHETIFENRLGYTQYLNRMGANISMFASCLGEAPCRFSLRNHTHSAVVHGPTPLHAADFAVPNDIRAAFSLVIAGLVAQGTTRLRDIGPLQRKYDSFISKFSAMGADIRIVQQAGTD